MKAPEYLLFRMNLVDRESLFQKPVSNNVDLLKTLRSAADERCDYKQKSVRSGWQWSLRDVYSETLDSGQAFAWITLSHEMVYRSGKIVRPEGVTQGVSTIQPPTATTIQIFIDLNRHLVAIEEVASLMKGKPGWRKALEMILDSGARWADFTSRIRLTPIAPRQVVDSRLATFERVTRIRATLRIPNPDLSPTFKRLFDELRQGNIRELTEDMRSERGLEMSDGSLPRATLDMALNGYRSGKVRVYGFGKGNKPDEYTIADDVARIEGVRYYAEGFEAGAKDREAKRAAQAIIDKINDLLPRRGGQADDQI